MHPLPKGTRVVLKMESRWHVYRVLECRWVDRRRTWYYQLCADEYWETKGIIYVQEGPDVGEKFAGAAQDADMINLWYDLPQPPTAEQIYETLRRHGNEAG